MMSKMIMIAVAGTLGLAACTDSKNRIAHDGQFFRAKISKVDKQRDSFVVSVKEPGKSVKGARSAAHHKATAYCVENFGTSQIIWQVNPLDETVPLTVADNQISFQGVCPQAQHRS